MYELVFVACLVAAPDVCREKALQYADIPNPMACMMGAQPRLAEWAQHHPRWRVTEWRCHEFGRREVKA